MALACQQKLWGRAVLWSPSKWVGSELGKGMLVPAEQGAERRGRCLGLENSVLLLPTPTPRAARASLFSHHILSGSGRPRPSGSPLSHNSLPAPTQASCLGDLLPAPLLPDLGRVTRKVLPCTHMGPSFGPQTSCLPLLFLPKGTGQPQ